MIKVFYDPRQVADQGQQSIPGALKSPSARKPAQIADALRNFSGIEFVVPEPLSVEDFKLAHDPNYVDGIMSLDIENGFGTKSQAVVDSLPWTNGAMFDALRYATHSSPCCALVSGFHHAGYSGWRDFGYFCTFNGLLIAAAKLGKKVAIIDCDQHWGNGTDDILTKLPKLAEKVYHDTFGKRFYRKEHAKDYLEYMKPGGQLENNLNKFEPDVILYQAGADVHIDDPYGGIFTTEQILERDICMFTIAERAGFPICWNLAGGYQIEPDGSIPKVIEIHLNTFKACMGVLG